MDPSNTAVDSSSLPPLPPGATLNTDQQSTPPPAAPSGAGGLPPLPPGATLNNPSAPPVSSVQTQVQGQLNDLGATSDPSSTGAELLREGKQAYSAIKKGGAETLNTLDNVLRVPAPGQPTALSLAGGKKAVQDAANAPVEGIAGATGYTLENIAEWMLGEGAAKSGLEGLSLGEKLSKIGPVVKFLEKHPHIAEMMGTQLAQKVGGTAKEAATVGAGSAAQAAVHGATPEEALEAGAIGGGTGAIINAGREALLAGIQHISPSVENIGGTDITRLASQHPYSTTAQSMAATAEHSNPVQRAQQAAGKEIISGAAKGAAERNLEEVNAGRTPTPRAQGPANAPYKFQIGGTGATERSEGTVAHQPRKQQTGTRIVEGKGPTERQNYTDIAGQRQQVDTSTVGATNAIPEAGTPPQTSHRSPVYEMKPESKPGSVPKHDIVEGGGTLITEDPNVAKAHIARLNDAIDEADPDQRAGLQAQRADLQRQMGEYHDSIRGQQASPYNEQPTFSPVDISKSVSRVGSFGDAADELEGSAKEVYNRLDDLTGGRFTSLREENKRAWKAVENGGGAPAEAKLADTQQQIASMLDGKDGQVGDSVNDSDLAFANDAWKKAQVLRDVHVKVENAFDTSLGTSDRANAYRGFNGNKLRANLKALSDTYGERPLIRVMGQDQFDNLTKLADITRTQADRAKFGGGVNHVAAWIIKNEGKVHAGVAAAGGGVGSLIGGAHGAAIGATSAEAAYTAARMVMRQIATNPKIGRQFATAIQYGARPQMYAPMIGGLIRANQDPQDGQQ